jgi:hypothetical protein
MREKPARRRPASKAFGADALCRQFYSRSKLTWLIRELNRQEQAERTEDERQYDRESTIVQPGEITAWQRQDKAAMLDRGDNHGYGTEQDERYSNAA